ncbi:MAG: PAS domain S-box protein [Candidatus Kapaibacterium sp.]
MELESIQHDSSFCTTRVLPFSLSRCTVGFSPCILFFLVFLACSFSTNRLTAQHKIFDDQWRWTLFTTEDGLPSHRVFDILETPDGTIWASTQRGLAWFNGYYWTAIRPSDGLPDSRIREFDYAAGNSILAHTDSSLYRGDIHGFTKINLYHDGRRLPIDAIATLPNGQHLLLSKSKLFQFDGRTTTISPYKLPPEMTALHFKQMFRSSSGEIWLSSAHHLYRLSNGQWTPALSSPTSPLNIDQAVSDTRGGWLASVVIPSELRGVWESQSTGQAVFHNAKEWKFPQKIVEAPNGDMLVLSASGSIFLRQSGIWQYYINPPRQMQDLLFLKYRANGDLWVGTESGLYLYQASSRRWESWSTGKTDDRNSINEILITRDSAVWVARALGVEIHAKNGSTTSIEMINGVPLGSVTALAEDVSGGLWIGSGVGTEGVYRYDGSRWEHYGKKEAFGARTVHKIVPDRRKRLWFLGLDNYDTLQYNLAKGPGVFILDSGRITPWEHSKELQSGRVYSFAESRDGAYWFGTYSGLSRWKDGHWKHWTTASGLRAQRIYTIAIDSQNRVWFGDQHNGLGFVAADTILYRTTSDGLVSDAVQDIKVDAQNKLWIATKGGLSSYFNGRWETFDAQSGLSNSRLWPVTPTKEKVYIGSSGGGVIIINKISDTRHPPRVVFAAPAIEDNSVILKWKPYSYFAAYSSKNLETRYRIDDGEFSAWSSNHQVVATTISPGTHRLQVQVKEILRPVDEAGYTTTFVIPYPLHRNPYVLLPIGILLGGIVALMIIIWRRRRNFIATLRDSEERFRTLIESMSEGVMHVNNDDVILFVNQRLCEMLGYTAEELVGKVGKELFFSAEDRHIIDEKNALRLHNVSDKYQIQIRKKSGEVMWAEISGAPRHDHTGAIIGSIGIITDITEQKLADENLANMHALFQKTFHANPDASILTRQPDRTILDVNSAFENVFGYRREDVIGISVISLDLWVSPDERLQALDQLTLTGRVRDFEFEFRTANGSTGHGIYFAEVIELESEKYVLNNVIDITKRKQIENDLKHSYSLLTAALESTADGILVVGLDGRISSYNSKFLSLWNIPEHIASQGDDRVLLSYATTQLKNPEEFIAKVNDLYRTPDATSYDEIELTDGRVFERYSIPQRLGDEIIGRVWSFHDITISKRIEEMLRSKSAFLEALVHSSKDGILVVDSNGDIVFQNQHSKDLWKLPATVAQNNNDAKQVEYVKQNVLNPEAFIEKIDFLYLHPEEHSFDEIELTDGTVLERYSSPIIGAEGKYYGRVWFFSDITERKAAGEALRDSEERKKGILESALDGIITIDGESRILEFNPAAERIFGYDSESVVGQKLDIIIIPYRLRQDHFSGIQHYRRTSEAPIFGKRIELTALHADGREFPIELTVTKIMGVSEEIFTGFIRDITERKKAEEALRRSEEQFRLIAENTPDLITIFDIQGSLLYTSPAYKRILGNKEYLHTQDAFANIHPDDRDNARKTFRKIAMSGKNQQIDFRLLAWDGSIRYVESSGSAIKDAAGNIHQIIVVSRDVTERKQIEEQLLRSQRMESIGTLASGIAHDLNNILTPILLSIDLLRRTSTDERSRRMLDMLDGSAKRGASIVKQVLTFARGADGVLTTVRVEHILGEIQKIIHETFLKSIEISIIADKDLPTVTADPTQLYQVLLNLCVNARDAMPTGGLIEIKATTVHLDELVARKQLLTRAGKYVVLHVKDEGTGISPEVIDRIFEPFFTTKEVGKGTGLGLSTVFAIIKNHSGFVNVTSELGRGTTFSIYLPADTVTEVDEDSELPGSTENEGQTILVVDDEAAILEITVSELIERGYSVLSAGNGMEALDVFRQHRHEIALIITDMVMPVMDGPALIKEVHAMNPHMKIIGVSGLKQYGEVALEDNVAFIHKPYTLEKLIATITTVFGS